MQTQTGTETAAEVDHDQPLPYIGAIILFAPPIPPPPRKPKTTTRSATVYDPIERGYHHVVTEEVEAATVPPPSPVPAVVFGLGSFAGVVSLRTLGENSECLYRVAFAEVLTPGYWSWPGR